MRRQHRRGGCSELLREQSQSPSEKIYIEDSSITRLPCRPGYKATSVRSSITMCFQHNSSMHIIGGLRLQSTAYHSFASSDIDSLSTAERKAFQEIARQHVAVPEAGLPMHFMRFTGCGAAGMCWFYKMEAIEFQDSHEIVCHVFLYDCAERTVAVRRKCA